MRTREILKRVAEKFENGDFEWNQGSFHSTTPWPSYRDSFCAVGGCLHAMEMAGMPVSADRPEASRTIIKKSHPKLHNLWDKLIEYNDDKAMTVDDLIKYLRKLANKM